MAASWSLSWTVGLNTHLLCKWELRWARLGFFIAWQLSSKGASVPEKKVEACDVYTLI